MKTRILLIGTLLFFLIIPIIIGILNIPGVFPGADLIYNLSRLAALIALILFGIEIILGARIKWIETYFGHDKMVGLHWKFGIGAFVLVLFHGVVGIFTALGRDGFGLLLGIVAFFLFLIMLAFILVRKIFNSRYEYWEIVHQLNYVLFPMAFIHSLALGTSFRTSLFWQILWGFIGVCFVVVIIYKTIRLYQIREKPFLVTKVSQETPNIWTIQFQPPKQMKYLPGQFMVLRFEKNGQFNEPHPFTISSSPTEAEISVSIKEAGDFTNQIGKTKVGDRAYIDAPYGRFSFLNFPAEEYIFIAGGIGITPFMSMLRYMRDKQIAKKVLLFWGNRTEQDIAFRDELKDLGRSMKELQVVHVLSDVKDWSGEKGFITADRIKKYTEDFGNKEIFICGPPIMLKMVLLDLKKLGVTKKQIHFEEFTW